MNRIRNYTPEECVMPISEEMRTNVFEELSKQRKLSSEEVKDITATNLTTAHALMDDIVRCGYATRNGYGPIYATEKMPQVLCELKPKPAFRWGTVIRAIEIAAALITILGLLQYIL